MNLFSGFVSRLAAVCVFALFGCNRAQTAVDWDQELLRYGKMGEFYDNFASKKCIGKCQWLRVNEETLRFTGIIENQSFIEFQQKIDSHVNSIQLNSGGGKVKAALQIAKEIRDRKLSVSVEGFCISSCANYLFLAGVKKTISGIVGFHGSLLYAAIDKNKCLNFMKEKECEVHKDEYLFFKSVGVAQELFRTTQSDDKGMADGREYMYYAPSSETLRKMGVTNINGDQNDHFLSDMRALYEKHKLVEFSVATDPNPSVIALYKGFYSDSLPYRQY